MRAIERGELPPVLKMGNLDPERDVMDVRDTVRAYRAMMASAEPGVPYNVCGGRAIRIGDLVDLFRSRARVPVAIELDPARMRPSDVPRLWGSHDRLTRAHRMGARDSARTDRRRPARLVADAALTACAASVRVRRRTVRPRHFRSSATVFS